MVVATQDSSVIDVGRNGSMGTRSVFARQAADRLQPLPGLSRTDPQHQNCGEAIHRPRHLEYLAGRMHPVPIALLKSGCWRLARTQRIL
jgi:hypothetical protein